MAIDFLSVLEGRMQRFAALLERDDLTAPVPSTPGWSLFDLADHLGGVHQWAAHAIVHGNPDGTPTKAPARHPADWYRESAAGLMTVLADEARPAWHFGSETPRIAGWWRRRQVHEVTVHLWDAQNALGAAEAIDPDLAEDGIDEVRHVFFPRQVRLRRIPPLSRSVQIGEHVFGGDGTGDVRPEATVTGPAEVLYLALWQRVSPHDPRLVVSGDREAVTQVLTAQVTA
ncbi:maleylpyruvate isomerase family mycothiol-dependent enzyme [Kineosporia succinea]|uniref:Uncharacterized protein (TIGR03083 family) n=1 Tax=Kineosporia succinea TaxID=84632 RepID=A0ABT9P235_9ACTN|nr:maleylpyruvate isomerase family mycothiol-dependent enzyme [Kineosporia succinea]MDP9826577.1 uncharacterized protein (TIGR03083 family) [Kineosporia succinea]